MNTLPEHNVGVGDAKFRSLIAQAPVAMSVVMGLQFTIELVNEKQLTLWQKEETEVLHKPLFVVFPEAKSQEFEGLLTQVYHTGIPFTGKEVETQLVRKGTLETAYFDFTYQPMRNELGEVEGIMVVSTEVTDYVHTRKQIESAASFNRSVLESSPDWLMVLDRQGRIQYMNGNGLCQLEIDDFATVNQNDWWTLWGSENEALLKASLDKALTGQTADFTAFCPTAKGTPKWWDVVLSPMGKPGQPVQQLMAVSRDVTEKRVAQEQIRKSEELFKLVFDNSLATILITDDQGNYFSANQAASKLLGYSVDELLQMNVADLKTTVQAGAAERFNQYISKGEESGEFDFITKEGTHKFGKYQSRRLKADFNLCIMMDITEQKLAEAEIIKSRERLKTGLSVASVALSEIDYTAGLVALSPEAAALYGLPPDNLMVTRDQLHATFHPDCRQELDTFIEQVMSPEFQRVMEVEHPVLLSDGGVRWLKVNKKVYFDHTIQPAKPLYCILATIDITAKKESDLKIAQSEKQFRLFADSIQSLAWIAHGDGLPYWYNKRWYEYSGTTFDEMNGWGWEKVLHPDHIDRVKTFTKEALEKAEAYEATFPLRRHDGAYRWFHTCAYPVKDTNGTVERWIATSTDIAEQKLSTELLEEQVNKRTEELQAKNKQLELINAELASFSFITSHDLKEPLRKIQTYSKLITDTESLSDKTQGYFSRITSAIGRMQNLIDSLLTLSRTNAGELILTPCDLTTIVEEALSDLQGSILDKQARIAYENLPTINGLAVQLIQLFTNLIGNSIKYSRAGIPPYIKISSSISEGQEIDHPSANHKKAYHVITIADNGIGFDNEHASKIFDLFQRLHNKNDYSGTGIGLAIVKKIVANHHGFIAAEGKPNVGSLFTVYFPHS